MEEKFFNIEGLIQRDITSCIPLEPFLVTLSDIIKCRCFGGDDEPRFDSLREEFEKSIRTATGEFVTHKEGDITYLHGVKPTRHFFECIYDNSLNRMEVSEGLEWFNLVSKDDGYDFPLKGDFPYQLNILDSPDGEGTIFGYSDGNMKGDGDSYEKYVMEGSIPIPCIFPEYVNEYLFRRYGIWVSIAISLTESKDGETFESIFKPIIQQLNDDRFTMLFDEDKCILVNGIYHHTIHAKCCSHMGAYSYAFNMIRDRIIDKSINFN